MICTSFDVIMSVMAPWGHDNNNVELCALITDTLLPLMNSLKIGDEKRVCALF